MIGISNYHESKYDEFKFRIIGECIEPMFNEVAYQCILLPDYQPLYASGDSIFLLRKSLFCNGGIYKLLDEEYEPINLFDFTY